MTGLLSILIAQAAGGEPAIRIPLDDGRFLAVLIVVGLPVLLNMVNGILSVIGFFKTDPPHYEKYATKEELEEAEDRLNGKIATDVADLRAVEARLAKNQQENKVEIQRHLHQQDRSSSSLQEELKGIHRQLGQIDGTLKAMAKR